MHNSGSKGSLPVMILAAGLAAACGNADDNNGDIMMTPTNVVPSPGGSMPTSPTTTSSGPSIPTTNPTPTTTGVGPTPTNEPPSPTGPNTNVPAPEMTTPGEPEPPGPEPTDTPTPEPTDVGPTPEPTMTVPENPTPTPGNCTITAEAQLSEAIATVGIVTWSTDLAGLTEAYIDFGPAGGELSLRAPVDVAAANLRTLLLGMKGEREYTYRITATAGGTVCTSADFSITTGPVANNVPLVERQVQNEAGLAKGFFILSGGIGSFGGGFGGGGGDGVPVYIIDSDGDVVWFADAPPSTSRALIDYEAKYMWMLELNVENGGAEVRRVSLDGLEVDTIAELSAAHHDFAVVPGGIVAAALWNGGGMDPHNSLVERMPDGTIRTVVADFNTLYSNNSYHPNAIHYNKFDDSYTISDRNPNLYVKVSRTGELLWQFGGNNPLGESFSGVTNWQVNHGHQMLEDGTFVFFNNGAMGGQSTVFAYHLDEGSMTAMQLWDYQSEYGSPTLGDVQLLPNGNILVTYSNSGVLQELDSSRNVLQTMTTDTMGYSEFRTSLYGEPLR